MVHEVPDLDVFFAVGGKFGPVLCNVGIKIKFAPVSQQQCAQKRHGFRRGVHVDDGIFLPGLGFCLVQVPAPQVND